MKQNKFYPAIVLGSICIVVALLLSVINMITAPIIEERKEDEANATLIEVLPEGKDFEELTITEAYAAIENAKIIKGWKASGGFVFQIEVSGYRPGLVIMCGIDSEGKIAGVKSIESADNFGAESILDQMYTSAAPSADTLTQLIPAAAPSKAPATTKGYYNAIKAAFSAVAIAGGGVTPEQQFQIDCNELLGTSDVIFTKWFRTEIIEGVDAVYESSNNSGRVYKIGEKLIGVKADGAVVGDATADESAIVIAADAIISSGVLTDITASLGGAYSHITKAWGSANGGYVFEMSIDGYKTAKNSYESSGANKEGNIVIKVSISADGMIIDVVTLAQFETPAVGDVCATEDYYNEYKGAYDSDIKVSADREEVVKNNYVNVSEYEMDLIPNDSTDIGAISNATFTTVAYQTAIKEAFKAFNALTAEGDN